MGLATRCYQLHYQHISFIFLLLFSELKLSLSNHDGIALLKTRAKVSVKKSLVRIALTLFCENVKENHIGLVSLFWMEDTFLLLFLWISNAQCHTDIIS